MGSPVTMDDPRPEFVATLLEELGDDAEGVAEYGQDDYRFLYERPDVEERYSPEDVEATFDDMVIQGIGRDYLERLFHAGALDCTIHRFDDAVVCHFIDDYSGIVVSFDADVDVSLVDFLDRCQEILSPRLEAS